MRISDWSSDVCSSDLIRVQRADVRPAEPLDGRVSGDEGALEADHLRRGERQVRLRLVHVEGARRPGEVIGRASCRERVCQYVSISVVAVSLKKKTKITPNT